VAAISNLNRTDFSDTTGHPPPTRTGSPSCIDGVVTQLLGKYGLVHANFVAAISNLNRTDFSDTTGHPPLHAGGDVNAFLQGVTREGHSRLK